MGLLTTAATTTEASPPKNERTDEIKPFEAHFAIIIIATTSARISIISGTKLFKGNKNTSNLNYYITTAVLFQ